MVSSTTPSTPIQDYTSRYTALAVKQEYKLSDGFFYQNAEYQRFVANKQMIQLTFFKNKSHYRVVNIIKKSPFLYLIKKK